jgi:Anti-sigma-K factor rskA/Putative zinc-finger
VSGCRTHGALLGGYVLGALEPAEMQEVRRHLESCPQCTREEAKLSGLPALLDNIEPSDVPPPQLSPELEEIVLDRFVRERQQQREPRVTRWRRMPVLAAASGIAAALLLALVVLVAGDSDDSAYATSDLRGPAAGPRGKAWLTTVDAGTHVSLQAKQLPTGGGVYELWCVRPDRTWVSGGTFRARADGRAAAEFTAAVEPGDYHLIVITRTPAGAPEGARGSMVLRGHLKY